MAPSISIVLIDTDPTTRKDLEAFLKTVDQVVLLGFASDYGTGFDLVVRTRPMVVMVDLNSDPDKAFKLVERILKSYPTTSIFATSSDSSSDTILRAMRLGCTEYLLRPVNTGDLMNSLKKVGRLMVSMPAPASSENGRIITCYSPKGGTGNTTVASNLAVALHKATKKQVVLVDLDLEGGDAAMFLNLKTKYTISDVTTNIARLDRAFLQGVLSKHDSGIYLLAEPQNIEEAESITPGQVREVLSMLKGMFSYVVVDTDVGYGDWNLAALDSSDLVVLVGVLSLPTIKNIQKALDVFDKLGYSADKVKLLINRYLGKGDITIADAERTLGYKVFWNIPNDYHAVMTSINRGVPLTMLAPHLEISRSFAGLAQEARDYLGELDKKGRTEALTS